MAADRKQEAKSRNGASTMQLTAPNPRDYFRLQKAKFSLINRTGVKV